MAFSIDTTCKTLDTPKRKNFIDKLWQIAKSFGYATISAIQQGDKDVIAFMLAQDPCGYTLPNLAGCLPYSLPAFYRLHKLVKPHGMEEFIRLICLVESRYSSKAKLEKDILENGLEFTLGSKEQFQALLQDELSEADAKGILEKISRGIPLCEWEEDLLRSHEIPAYIIDQLSNIKKLSSLDDCSQIAELIYDAAYLRLRHDAGIDDLMGPPRLSGYVGPFFYIDGKLKAYKQSTGSFETYRRFFDAEVSHFHFFNELGLGGDYGHYPRGRVLYDNYHSRFVVYLDKSLKKDEIQKRIIEEYSLPIRHTFFRLDPHYQHDNL